LAVFESLRPSIYKVVAETGYDIVLVDTEHVMHNLDALTDFLVGARDNGLTPYSLPLPLGYTAPRGRLMQSGG
jgi:2-keto-3-deoxy-L-rhamnonate aldolase RhmA